MARRPELSTSDPQLSPPDPAQTPANRARHHMAGLRMCRINPLPGHPDLVLARAIRDHIIDRPQADLIGATRLEHESLSPAAARWCLPYQTCRRQRRCAERRLVRYLGHRSLIGPHRGHDNA